MKIIEGFLYFMLKNNSERDFYFFFAYSDLFGAEKISLIKNFFGTLEKAWLAEKIEWQEFKNSTVEKFFKFKKNFLPEREKNYLQENKINYLLLIDEDYPSNLKNISYPPPIIFYLGNIKLAEEQKEYSLAVVGSRIASAYGRQVAKELIAGLDKRFLIISGLAFGIDTCAHREALANGLKTGAVLGGPLEKDIISCPAENYWLAKKIIDDGGFIVTEFPPHSLIQKSNFPRRNRIIAGLCLGTLVVEAGRKSGANKTAEYARDANRVVMAVPGSIYSELSIGTNKLLKDHTDAVSGPEDIYRCLGIKMTDSKKSKIKNTENIKKIAGEDGLKIIKSLLLLNKIANIEEIIENCQLDTPCVHSTLTILELSGIVSRNSSGQILLSKNL